MECRNRISSLVRITDCARPERLGSRWPCHRPAGSKLPVSCQDCRTSSASTHFLSSGGSGGRFRLRRTAFTRRIFAEISRNTSSEIRFRRSWVDRSVGALLHAPGDAWNCRVTIASAICLATSPQNRISPHASRRRAAASGSPGCRGAYALCQRKAQNDCSPLCPPPPMIGVEAGHLVFGHEDRTC